MSGVHALVATILIQIMLYLFLFFSLKKNYVLLFGKQAVTNDRPGHCSYIKLRGFLDLRIVSRKVFG